MATTGIAVKDQEEHFQISPDYVRISAAAAIELGLKPGQINRCNCGCINLLQNYPQGCAANCSYCGLARERPGLAEDNSFIRVDWPLFETDLVAEKIGEKDRSSTVGRVCIAQVQDHRAVADLIDMSERVRRAAPQVPISALVTATLLNTEDLYDIQENRRRYHWCWYGCCFRRCFSSNAWQVGQKSASVGSSLEHCAGSKTNLRPNESKLSHCSWTGRDR